MVDVADVGNDVLLYLAVDLLLEMSGEVADGTMSLNLFEVVTGLSFSFLSTLLFAMSVLFALSVLLSFSFSGHLLLHLAEAALSTVLFADFTTLGFLEVVVYLSSLGAAVVVSVHNYSVALSFFLVNLSEDGGDKE